MSPEAIIKEVKEAKLRGRGGGGFPAGSSGSRAVKPRESRYVICNADEGDPELTWTVASWKEILTASWKA